MLIGFIGLAVIHTLLGLAFFSGAGGNYVLVLALAAMAVYALTTAPVVWVVLAEIFPNRIRGAALSISVFSLWTACFILTSTYPLLEEHLGQAVPVLDLRRDLRHGIRVYRPILARNQGQDPGRDRAGIGGLRSPLPLGEG